jgi:hypothetical protein
MTEAEWFECREPEKILDWLRAAGKLSDRKARLFAVACCRRIWGLLGDERSRRAVEVAERFADGLASEEEFEAASDAACAVWDEDMEQASTEGKWNRESLSPPYTVSAVAYNVAIPLGWWGAAPAFRAPDEIVRETTANGAAEGAAQCVLLRDIFGNPFRPLPAIDRMLTGTGGNVRRLAEAAYEDRDLPSGHLDPIRLAVLADALEDAGVTDAALPEHLRGPGFHIRGCHVLDALLGKP